MLIGIVAMTFACRGGVIPETEVPATLPIAVATPLAKLEYKRDAELEKQFAEIAKAAGGKVGVAAVVLETGEAAFLNEDGRYPMQSVYKLPIAMALMEQVRLDKFDLDEKVGVTKEDFVRAGMRSPLRDANPNGGEFTIRELIRLSLVESDGTASDVQLRLVPPVDVQSFLTQIGVRDMKVVNTEKEIGKDWKTQYENWSTPIAAVELLRWFAVTARAGRESIGRVDIIFDEGFPVIYQMAVDSNPGANRLKAQLPKGTVVSHKTGTGGTQNGITGATNDIGVIHLPNGKHMSIAVYVSDSPADEKTREATIARIAKAAWDKWVGNSVSSLVSKTNCSKARESDEIKLCNAVLPKDDFYRIDSVSWETFEISHTSADLNNDGRKEVIAWQSSFAGTSGGSLWVFEKKGERFHQLYENDSTWTPIVKLPVKNGKWHSIAYLQAGGGVKTEFIGVGMTKGKYTTVGQKPVELNDESGMPKGEVLIGKAWEQSTFGPMTTNE